MKVDIEKPQCIITGSADVAQACLKGGEWHSLLPDHHPGIAEVKWCRNRFTPFLCVDPEVRTVIADLH